MRLHETGNNTCFDYETIRSYRKDPVTAGFPARDVLPGENRYRFPARISRWGTEAYPVPERKDECIPAGGTKGGVLPQGK